MNQNIEDFIEELKKRPDVLGIILFGSWARGNNRPDSDVDLIVILQDSYKRTVEYKNNQAFEIIYITAKGAFEYWESHKDDCFGTWEVARILYDKDGSIKTLQTKVEAMLKEGKKPIDESQIGQYKFDAEDLVKYVESILGTDSASASYLLTNKLFNLTEMFFDLRQEWIPAPKQRLFKIKKINPELYTLLEQFFSKDKTLEAKLATARKILTIIFKK